MNGGGPCLISKWDEGLYGRCDEAIDYTNRLRFPEEVPDLGAWMKLGKHGRDDILRYYDPNEKRQICVPRRDLFTHLKSRKIRGRPEDWQRGLTPDHCLFRDGRMRAVDGVPLPTNLSLEELIRLVQESTSLDVRERQSLLRRLRQELEGIERTIKEEEELKGTSRCPFAIPRFPGGSISQDKRRLYNEALRELSQVIQAVKGPLEIRDLKMLTIIEKVIEENERVLRQEEETERPPRRDKASPSPPPSQPPPPKSRSSPPRPESSSWRPPPPEPSRAPPPTGFQRDREDFEERFRQWSRSRGHQDAPPQQSSSSSSSSGGWNWDQASGGGGNGTSSSRRRPPHFDANPPPPRSSSSRSSSQQQQRPRPTSSSSSRPEDFTFNLPREPSNDERRAVQKMLDKVHRSWNDSLLAVPLGGSERQLVEKKLDQLEKELNKFVQEMDEAKKKSIFKRIILVNWHPDKWVRESNALNQAVLPLSQILFEEYDRRYP